MSAQETAGDMHSVVERRLRRIDQRYTSGGGPSSTCWSASAIP